MGDKEKYESDEVFSDRLGWPLDLTAIEVLWFHKRPPLACRSLAGAIKREKSFCASFSAMLPQGSVLMDQTWQQMC